MKPTARTARKNSGTAGRSWFGHLAGLESEYDTTIEDVRTHRDLKKAATHFRGWLHQFRDPYGAIAASKIVAGLLVRSGWSRDKWGAWVRDGVDLRSSEGRTHHPRAHTILVAHECMTDLHYLCRDTSDEIVSDLDTAFRAGVIWAEAMVYAIESNSMKKGRVDGRGHRRRSTIAKNAVYDEMRLHEELWLRGHPGQEMQNKDFGDVPSLKNVSVGALSTRVWRYRVWKKSQVAPRTKSLR